MAKLKGPLFSLGASQKLGDALVYFNWKGLNVVREYVIPANPKTDPQKKQRGYLTDAVADIHAAQAIAAKPLGEKDTTAYALWASVVKAATTWFNQAVKNWIDQMVDSKKPTVYRGGNVDPGANELVISVYSDEIVSGKIETGQFKYGPSKTALVHTFAATPDLDNHYMTATITPLTKGTKYFIQFVPLTVDAYVGAKSGIYHGTPTA